MANMYRSVLASGGTTPTGDAVAADVLTGKTFSNAQATGISGTMPNNGAVSGTATPNQPYTIPAGYHNGSGQVTAADTSAVDFIFAYTSDNYCSIIDCRDSNNMSTQLVGDTGTATFGDVVFTLSNWNVSINKNGYWFEGSSTAGAITKNAYTSGGTIPHIATNKYPHGFKITT